MTSNEMITAVNRLKVGDDVTLNGYAVVKYGRKNFHVFAAGDLYGRSLARREDAYGVAMFIRSQTTRQEPQP